MFAITEIAAVETFPVRHPVLRPGKSLNTCHFVGDDLKTTIHFGLFEDSRLVGVISIFNSKTYLIENNSQCQIRGMAVLAECQSKGYGTALMKYAENFAKQNDYKTVWFNARETAIAFYEGLGYKILGNPFTIADVGIHYLMYKDIK